MKSPPQDKGYLFYFAMAAIIFAFFGGLFIGNGGSLPNLTTPNAKAFSATVDKLTLVIKGADIQAANGTIWHAWTFNGTVPGPTIHMMMGDVLSVHVINTLNLTHSFHTHLPSYNFTSDGSQANVIGGMGANAMIPPGKSYTYNLTAPEAGIFYYHCHSGDQHPITYHIHQGLYGAIIVDDPRNMPKVNHDWVIFMGEEGEQFTGNLAQVPPFIMDGKGYPGGEPALMNLFMSKGFGAVANQLNKTLLAFEMKQGETARISIVNIGDLTHTFHLHGLSMISEWYMPGREWPANVVPLDPGAADSVIVSATQQGLWLFHCHVVAHADAGMIGILIVTKP